MHTGSLDKRFLEQLAAHAGLLDRHPVLETDDAGSHALRQLIHRTGGLSRINTRRSSDVGDTLNSRSSIVKSDTGGCKGTNVAGHFRKIINGKVSVLVQVCQNAINIIEGGSSLGRVGQDCLDRIHFDFVLGKTCKNRPCR